ncbi:MAG: transposase [Candidatus Saccharibacteria bacterium]
MPSRNVIKRYDVNSYYHIYNRGVEKRKVFIDDEDYAVFLNLFKRYLNEGPEKDNKGREYDWLAEDVELMSFCLMPNHFHLLLYQIRLGAITKLLRSVCSAYTTYFNKKYERVGPLFQGVFKASHIYIDDYLTYITRYIHRNPTDYLNWEWSSLPYWINNKRSAWVSSERLNDMAPAKYLEFLNDDEDYRDSLDEIGDFMINK